MRRPTRVQYSILLALLVICSSSAFGLPATPGPRGVIGVARTGTVYLSPKQQQEMLTTSRASTTALKSSPKDGDYSSAKSSSRSVLAVAALSSWGLAAGSAELGLLPGLLQADGTFAPYTDTLLLRDLGATLLTGTLGYLLVQFITWLATPTEERPEAYLKPRDARKVIHTLSAPAYMLFWPLFSNAAGARVFAATVPLINAVRLYLAAKSDDDSKLAAAVSRSGDRSEALGGPFIYVIIMAVSILLFWRDSPAGIVALSTMAAGDGLADLLGRRFGQNNPWPVQLTGSENRKSVAGSLALVIASVATSAGLLLWFQSAGCLTLTMSLGALVGKLAVITGAAAIVELLPFADDNYTVPAVAAILSVFLLG